MTVNDNFVSLPNGVQTAPTTDGILITTTCRRWSLAIKALLGSLFFFLLLSIINWVSSQGGIGLLALVLNVAIGSMLVVTILQFLTHIKGRATCHITTEGFTEKLYLGHWQWPTAYDFDWAAIKKVRLWEGFMAHEIRLTTYQPSALAHFGRYYTLEQLQYVYTQLHQAHQTFHDQHLLGENDQDLSIHLIEN